MRAARVAIVCLCPFTLLACYQGPQEIPFAISPDSAEAPPAAAGALAEVDEFPPVETRLVADNSGNGDARTSAAEIFDRRILPIARSDAASSCTECHFGGVELKNYIREDQTATFAALRDDGWIDVQRPDESKILRFINRHTDGTSPLLAKVREAELQAFRAWIHAAVEDPQLLAAKSTDVAIGTELPVEVVRHLRRDRVLQSFVENVWSEMGRCMSCHSPEKNQRLLEKHGERISWIVPGNPGATLKKLVAAGNIDLDDPEQSLVLLKPAGLEEHGGGPKFAVGSRTDKNFRRFLVDYAAVVDGSYERSEQLPLPSPDVAVLTGQHLRIDGLPESLGRMLLKADIYRWTDDGWSESPWGTAENPINGRQQAWQSMVFAVAPRGSDRAKQLQDEPEAQLPDGRYLIKIYIDRDGLAKKNRDYELGEREFYGQVETSGPWPAGYQPPKIVAAPNRP